MIDEVVSKLLQRMTGKLTEDELHDLDVEMRIVLNDYEISIRNTELMTGIQSCDYYLKLFLARKHTEGKSARTIKSYKYQLSRLFEKLNMPVDRITENDLFLY